jgi:hypothetical protein
MRQQTQSPQHTNQQTRVVQIFHNRTTREYKLVIRDAAHSKIVGVFKTLAEATEKQKVFAGMYHAFPVPAVTEY